MTQENNQTHKDMKNEIRIHLENPRQLEMLYRTNKSIFKKDFSALYPELRGNALAEFWNERLHYEADDTSRMTTKDLLFVIVASLLAGIVAKLPAILSLDETFFYPRNIGFIVFPFLAAYFAWKNKLSIVKAAAIGAIGLVSLIFINTLPADQNSNTLVLSCVHLVVVLWALTGFAFSGGLKNTEEKRLGYLKYNGDLVVMTALILIAGGIMTGITIGLFSLLGFSIEKFYFEYVVVIGLPAAPILGTWLIQTNPTLVGRVSPVIARLFSPLVLVMLVIYLGAILYSGKDPYNDREFLLIFNALLIGVMAIIFFSVAESAAVAKSKMEIWVLFLLSAVTVVVNGIALSAILFRISEWGLTPNRAAVLGGNILFLINLLLVTVQLYRAVAAKAESNSAGLAIARFLPIYVAWAAMVTFLFPFLFSFK
jgi:hypothetical protein